VDTWLFIGLAVAVAWALWERARGSDARALRAELDAANGERAQLRIALAAATERAEAIQRAAIAFSEACNAEIPKIVESIEDPRDRERVARDVLGRMLETAFAETSAAADRARGVLPTHQPARFPEGGDGAKR
jgi:predicted O-linked N-acetylglucosamine transferase (SPINDLY family)